MCAHLLSLGYIMVIVVHTASFVCTAHLIPSLFPPLTPLLFPSSLSPLCSPPPPAVRGRCRTERVAAKTCICSQSRLSQAQESSWSLLCISYKDVVSTSKTGHLLWIPREELPLLYVAAPKVNVFDLVCDSGERFGPRKLAFNIETTAWTLFIGWGSLESVTQFHNACLELNKRQNQ